MSDGGIPLAAVAPPRAGRKLVMAVAPLVGTAAPGASDLSWLPQSTDSAAGAQAASPSSAMPEQLSILHDVVAELKGYGIPPLALVVAMIWIARTLGKLEATAAAAKEVAASANAATEAKVAAAKEVVAEVAKSVAIAAELAALKAVKSEAKPAKSVLVA